MSFHYHFGGLALASSIPLPDLRPGRGPARRQVQVTAQVGAAPIAEAERYVWPGRYRVRLGEAGGRWLMQSAFDGAFLIDRDGGALHLICERLPPAQVTLDVLTRRVLPRLPILSGATAVHAATVARGGQGLLLLGPSGAGKSTLAAALAHLGGWEILSDDMSVLWDNLTLAPAAPGICVWPATQAALGLPPEACRELPGCDGKLRYAPTGQDGDAPVRLRGFVWLQREAEAVAPRLEPLTRAEGMTRVGPQALHFDASGAGGGERVSALLSLNAAMTEAPAWRLTYPGSFAALPETAAVLATLLTRSEAPAAGR